MLAAQPALSLMSTRTLRSNVSSLRSCYELSVAQLHTVITRAPKYLLRLHTPATQHYHSACTSKPSLLTGSPAAQRLHGQRQAELAWPLFSDAITGGYRTTLINSRFGCLRSCLWCESCLVQLRPSHQCQLWRTQAAMRESEQHHIAAAWTNRSRAPKASKCLHSTFAGPHRLLAGC